MNRATRKLELEFSTRLSNGVGSFDKSSIRYKKLGSIRGSFNKRLNSTR